MGSQIGSLFTNALPKLLIPVSALAFTLFVPSSPVRAEEKIHNKLAQRGAMRSLRGDFLESHNRIGATADEFTNVQTLDFQLRSDKSAAVNAGVLIPAINEGVPDGKADLGAYEFGRAPWTAGASLQKNP